jgi:3-isopropylmalate dehydrogenase
MLRSVALLLDHGLARPDLAAAVGEAVDEALVSRPTRDAGGDATTTDFGDAVLASLDRKLSTKEEAWARTPS